MKFISWNVNGIRAAWQHGLAAFLDATPADIYAFQETRTDEAFPLAELPGYYAYWSFCDRKGYSGTMCLTKHKPLNVFFDMGNDASFDIEGRIITLEFEQFYFVNCYVPNSQGSEHRYDYRSLWDEHFLRYLSELRNKKPTVVCGDFNTTPSDADIYAENKVVAQNAVGFQSTERESFLQILDCGYTDTFRYLYPDERDKYTWWSNRRYKRSENRGWRLDYFLVSDDIISKVAESTMFSEVYGSDHCPIMLVASISPSGEKAGKAAFPSQEEELRTKPTLSNYVPRKDMAKLWNTYDWEQAEQNLANMQMMLTKAAYARNYERIMSWQKRIVSSLDAKVLAVRHTCNAAAGTGVDKIKWTTAHEKMSAALSLNSKGYHALPSRLVLIRSKNGKQRRIHIETYFDRAMECLYAYALDPVAEAWGDRMSFAYRKGRSSYDLNAYIQQALSGKNAPVWLFIADVRKCYENISHNWIMENIPMSKSVLYQFLKAGYVFGGELFPVDVGVGIGRSIAPIIANMTLDGLQQYVYTRLYPDGNIDYANGNMFRYADDIMFTARTEAEAWKIQTHVTEFLQERGLKLSYHKSKIINIEEENFTFMSRTYTKVAGRLAVRPSDAAIERFMNNLKDTIMNYSGSQQSLIKKVNQKIDGWATFHKVGDAEEAFHKMDIYITALLLQLCETKHPTWSRERILQKYWYTDREGRHYYALPNKKDIRVKFLADTFLTDHNAVKSAVNPYIDIDYLEYRTQMRPIENVSGIYKEIWQRQDGRCHYCGHKILRDEEKTLLEIAPAKKRYIDRVTYVHNRCLSNSLDCIDTIVTPISLSDIRDLLKELDKMGRKRASSSNYSIDA